MLAVRYGASAVEGVGSSLRRVLVVDDELSIRLICRVNLEASGIEVLEATRGDEALELARAAQPEVILLDLMLPGLDGFAVAEKLVADPATQGIAIVFLSASTGFAKQARGIEIGGVDYLTKPFNPLELHEILCRLLARVARGEQDALRAEKLQELYQRFGREVSL
jgi:putative two-component system response regulator